MERKLSSLLRSSSLQLKLIVVFGLGFLQTTTALVVSGLLSTRSLEEAVRTTALESTVPVVKQRLLVSAREIGGSIRSEFQIALNCADTMALTLASLSTNRSNSDVKREEVTRMLRHLLAKHPSFVGTYTGWEPNAFDGDDARYRGTPAHDATGRFIPYWSRGSDGAIKLEETILVDGERCTQCGKCSDSCVVAHYFDKLAGEIPIKGNASNR